MNGVGNHTTKKKNILLFREAAFILLMKSSISFEEKRQIPRLWLEPTAADIEHIFHTVVQLHPD